MGVGGHQAGAQQALVLGRCGRQRAVDVHAVLVQILRDGQRRDLLVGVDGDDGHHVPVGGPHLYILLIQLLPHVQRVPLQLLHQFGMGLQNAQGRQGRRRVGGRDARREDEGTGAVLHVVHDAFGGGHVSAQGRQRFGEGPHVDVHLVLQAVIAGRAASALADHAQAVGVVHHDPGAVLLRQAADLRQVGDVSAHGENAVGDDQAALVFGHPLQLGLQVGHVVMLISQHLAVAQAAGVVKAGVVLLVHDDVVVQAGYRADDAQIGLEARGQGDDRLLAKELRQFGLQFEMQPQRPVEEAGAGAAGTQGLVGFHARRDDVRVCGQTQVVVGTEHDAALALHDDFGILFALQRMEIRIDAPLHDLIGKAGLIAFFKNIDHTMNLRNLLCETFHVWTGTLSSLSFPVWFISINSALPFVKTVTTNYIAGPFS